MTGAVQEPRAAAGRRLPWLTLFAVAFGLLEAAVVVYLRELYYPGGFRLPVVLIPDRIATVELARELATLLMLAAVSVLAGRSFIDRFFVFAYLFGVWDIVYYLGLWAILGWPDSPLTWDVLFLIPVPWLGPVLYPVLISLLLVGGFLVHDARRKRGRATHLTGVEWSVAAAGALLVVVAFCWNWRVVARSEMPGDFPVGIFVAGVIAGTVPFVRAFARAARSAEES
jgi:hypothetical protein